MAAGWRPWPLRGWYMSLLILTYTALVLLFQVLIFSCPSSTGCPVIGVPSALQVSLTDRILYQALPPAIAVLFSLLWLFPNHDLLRLEPFFQLTSRVQGVLADDWLLTKYGFMWPWDTVSLAWRRRHGIILLTMLINLVTAIGIGPVVSGVFDNSLVEVKRTVRGVAFAPVDFGLEAGGKSDDWSGNIPANFTDALFEHLVHNGPLPRFATTEYAVQPVQIALLPTDKEWVRDAGINDTFSADSKLYEADLECEGLAATVSFSGPFSADAKTRRKLYWAQGGRHVFHIDITPPASVVLPNKQASIRLTLCYVDKAYSDLSPEAIEKLGPPPGGDKCDRVFPMKYEAATDLDAMMGFTGEWIGHSSVLSDSTFWSIWLGPYDLNDVYKYNSSQSIDPSNRSSSVTICKPRYTVQEVIVGFNRHAELIQDSLRRVGEKQEWNGMQREAFERRFRYQFFPDAIGVDFGPETTEQPFYIDEKTSGPRYLQFGQAKPGHLALVDASNFAKRVFCSAEEKKGNPGSMFRDDNTYSRKCASMPRRSLLTYSALWAKNKEDAHAMLDKNVAEQRQRIAFKAMFAFAMAAAMDQTSKDPNGPDLRVTRTAMYRGFTVNTGWVRVGQVALELCALLIFALWMVQRRRPLVLEGEPGTISEALHTLANSPALRAEFENAEYRDPGELLEVLRAGGRRYRARRRKGGGVEVQVLAPANKMHTGEDRSVYTPLPPPRGNSLWLQIADWQLNRWYGILLVILTIVLTICIVVANHFSRKLNGLPTFGNTSSIKFKLLYTYTPFILSNALGPIFVSLCSVHCVIAPFDLLQRRYRPTRRILGLEFDARPPQMQFFTALRFRQFTISGLCIAFLASNVLTVTMTSLFSPFSREQNYTNIPVNMTAFPVYDFPNVIPAVVVSAFLENVTRSESEISKWTTPELYLLPFTPSNITQHINTATTTTNIGPSTYHSSGSTSLLKTYSGETLGLGISVKCRIEPVIALTDGGPENNYTQFTNVSTAGWGNLSISEAIAAGVKSLQWGADVAHLPVIVTPYEAWANYSDPARSYFKLNTGFLFGRSVQLAWWEFPQNPALTPPYEPELQALAVNCTFEPRAAVVRTTVDYASERVLRADVVGELDGKETEMVFGRLMDVDLADKNMESKNLDSMGSFIGNLIVRVVEHSQRLAGCPSKHCMLNHLMAVTNPSVAQPSTPSGRATFLPNHDEVEVTLQQLFQRLFVFALRLYTSPSPSPSTAISPTEPLPQLSTPSANCTVTLLTTHVTLNQSMFLPTLVLLAYLTLLLLYRVFMHHTLHGHIPTSLASTYALLYSADAVDPSQPARTVRERREGFQGAYSFGKFVHEEKVRFGVYTERVWEGEGGEEGRGGGQDGVGDGHDRGLGGGGGGAEVRRRVGGWVRR